MQKQREKNASRQLLNKEKRIDQLIGIERKILKPIIKSDKKLINSILEDIALSLESNHPYSTLTWDLSQELMDIHQTFAVGDLERDMKLQHLKGRTSILLKDIKTNKAPPMSERERENFFRGRACKLTENPNIMIDRSYELRFAAGIAGLGLKAGMAKDTSLGKRKFIFKINTSVGVGMSANVSLFKNKKVESTISTGEKDAQISIAIGLGPAIKVTYPRDKISGGAIGLGFYLPCAAFEIGPGIPLPRTYRKLRETFGIKYSLDQLSPVLYGQLSEKEKALHEELKAFLESDQEANTSPGWDQQGQQPLKGEA